MFANAKILKSGFSGGKATYACKNCGKDFDVRVADRARGWAKFCSKSCKASEQERRTGQWADLQSGKQSKNEGRDLLTMLERKNSSGILMVNDRGEEDDSDFAEDQSWDSHKT